MRVLGLCASVFVVLLLAGLLFMLLQPQQPLHDPNQPAHRAP
jgi:hypothetical protein